MNLRVIGVQVRCHVGFMMSWFFFYKITVYKMSWWSYSFKRQNSQNKKLIALIKIFYMKMLYNMYRKTMKLILFCVMKVTIALLGVWVTYLCLMLEFFAHLVQTFSDILVIGFKTFYFNFVINLYITTQDFFTVLLFKFPFHIFFFWLLES